MRWPASVFAVAFFSVCLAPHSNAAEPEKEVYREDGNATKVEDWETMRALLGSNIRKVEIDVDSPEALLAKLHELAREAGLGDLRFRFARDRWEQKLSDGSIGKVSVGELFLKLEHVDLLEILSYIGDGAGMTFDIRDNEVIFRPKFCSVEGG